MAVGTIGRWTLPLMIVLLGTIVVMVANVFLGVGWLDLVIWNVILVLFSLFTYYDVSLFTRHCSGENCCLDGTVNLWLDLVAPKNGP